MSKLKVYQCERETTDSPLPSMLGWAAVSLALWALFGWGVVNILCEVTK